MDSRGSSGGKVCRFELFFDSKISNFRFSLQHTGTWKATDDDNNTNAAPGDVPRLSDTRHPAKIYRSLATINSNHYDIWTKLCVVYQSNKECPTYLWKSSLLETQDNIRPWASEQLPVMLICEPKPIFCPRLLPGAAHPMVASEIPELRSFVENYFMLILKLAC